MYRHLRSKWNVVVAAVFTALCFGVMHAYPILMMGPVIALGFGFALLREWRGSLIASMTAHCVHNAVVLGLLLFAMRLLG
jgi:membrane protease YdiL (CAAX protease family)